MSAEGNPPQFSNSVSGDVQGPVVQVGVVHGGVHLHQSPSALPRQWAPPPPHFTNRSAELDELREALAHWKERCGLIVLSGLGGVGKTALALHWLHTVAEQFSDGQLYADLGGDERAPADPAVVLGGFLRSFGVNGEDLPNGLGQRLGWFRSLTAHKKVAILLDNATTAAQVRALLPPSPQSFVLVTSRRRLGSLVVDGARFVEVRPLATGDAVRLFRDTVGGSRVSEEQEQVEELARLCGGLPIALSVIAARLVTRRRLRVSDAVHELRAEKHRLSLLSRDNEVTVESVFDLSYDELSSGACAMYRAMGVHPGKEFSLGVAAAAGDIPAQEAANVVDELVEANLVDEVSHERFRFHDLVHLHARHVARTHEPSDLAPVMLRIAEYYLLGAQETWPVTTAHLRGSDYECATTPPRIPRFSDRSEALDWLEIERVNIITSIAAACEHELWAAAWQLSYAIWPLFRFHSHHDDWRKADEFAIQAAQALNNAEWEARATRRLAMLEQRLGHHERAEQLLDRCESLFHTINDAYGVANTREARAALALTAGDARSAIHHAREARDDFAVLGNKRKVSLADLLLGQALLLTGHTDDGITTLRNSRRALAEFREQDPFNVARTDLVVGQALAATGDPEAAAPLVDSGSEAMKQLRSRQGQALAHRAQAELARARGDLPQAKAHVVEAMSLYQHLGDPAAETLSVLLAELSRALDHDPTDPR